MLEKEMINRALVAAVAAEEMGFPHTAQAFLSIVADMVPQKNTTTPKLSAEKPSEN